MNCPICESECSREEVDGVQYEPWYCNYCGWHEQDEIRKILKKAEEIKKDLDETNN
jgi:hypothetical protein